MAKIPGFSLAAVPIRAALSEGRTEDAKTLVVALLRAGKADRVVQGVAAELLKPNRRTRGRPKTRPQHWYEIGFEASRLRDGGMLYEDILPELSEKFGFSESHITSAIRLYNKAKDEHDALTE